MSDKCPDCDHVHVLDYPPRKQCEICDAAWHHWRTGEPMYCELEYFHRHHVKANLAWALVEAMTKVPHSRKHKKRPQFRCPVCHAKALIDMYPEKRD